MHQLSWTRAAQRLCEELASSLAAFCERGKLRIGACSKCQGERVGEASNPGPPRAATGAFRDVADLVSAQLNEPSTLAIQHIGFGESLTDGSMTSSALKHALGFSFVLCSLHRF